MYKTYITFFLIISITTNGQTTIINLPNKLKNYYKYISQAEKSILIKEKLNASKYYKKAFEVFDSPFSSDIYNSLLVNLEINNEKLAIDDYLKLKCLNYTSSTIENNLDFKNIYVRNKKKIENYSCKNQLNLELKSQLDSLFFNDQNVRRQLYFSNDADKNKKINITDSINATKLNALFEKYGFIGEYDIGAQEGSDYVFLNYLFVILHQQQHDKKKTINFEPILHKALIEGKLKNKNFIDILGGMNSQKTGYSAFILYKIEDECCFVDKGIYIENRNEKSKKNIEAIEKKRSEIGLNTLDDALANKLFRLQNPKYKLEAEGIVEIKSKSFNEFLRANTIKITFEEFIKSRK